ncbi:TSUP family transporter [Candidatus Dependentiae bacterium]|nr:TSUP family transporter [Candidatus Dependentiae bacterium]
MILQAILITLLTTVTSGISTITGFGTTTICMPILLFFFPFHQTILFIAIIHWFQNIWRLILFKKGCCKKIIFYFAIPAMISSIIGARISIHMPENILIKIFGTFLIIYSTIIILKPKFMLKEKMTTSITGGLFSGFFSGIIGLGGAFRAAFLNAFNLGKNAYIFTTNAISFFIDTVRVPVYFSNGTKLSKFFFIAILMFIPTSLFATFLSKKLISKMPQEKFRLIVTIFLGFAGLYFILMK